MGTGLKRLIRPASIAVVGATERPGSYAAETLLNLRKLGFPGTVWGVNPGRREVFGHDCVPTVADLPVAVDAVVVAIPAASVPEAIEQAGARGCGGAVVFSAGFAEVAAGAELQRQLVAAAARHELPVCGPNCNGIVSLHTRTALWGDALAPSEAGAVALVSQSGNVAVNALATRRGLRFHTVISSGNQAVLAAADYLQLLANEDGVGAIALYLEDDGGPELCDGLAACADAGVPVTVLKVGHSAAGARAAASHSGALAGDQRVFRSLIAEAGALWADDIHDLLELAKTLAVRRRPPKAAGARATQDATAGRAADGGGSGSSSASGGLAILTCSGGDSAQGADDATALGLELPELTPSTRSRLAELLPEAATVGNPLDYTAMIWGDSAALGELIRIVGEDPAVAEVLVFYDQPPALDGATEQSWLAVRDGIIAGAAVSPAPTIVSSTLPELLDDGSAWAFAQAGVPAAAGLRTGIRCAAALLTLGDGGGEVGGRLRQIASTARRLRGPDRRASAQIAGAAADGTWLPEHEAKALLRDAGISVPDGRIVESEDDAVVALAELGGPLVLKLSAAAIQHKSELGGVELALEHERQLREAYRRLAPLAARHGGRLLAERMAPAGVELLVAAGRDGVVPALVLGLGGIWTELLDDVAVVPLPAGRERVERALRSLRGASLLHGGRGTAPVDVDAVVRLAVGIGELLLQRGLSTIECNPVLAGANGQGAVVVDAVIRELAARAGEDTKDNGGER